MNKGKITKEQEEMQELVQKVSKELQPILDKYEVDLIGQLKYTERGIVPTVAIQKRKKT